MENYVEQNPASKVFDDQISKSKFYTQIFLYFGLGILLTAVVCVLVSWAFNSIWPISENINGSIVLNEETLWVYLGVLVASSLVLLVLSFVITFKSLKGSGSLTVPYVLYSMVMGVLLSSFTFFIGDTYIIGEALFITALLFLGMCGIGYLTHNKLATWAKVAIGFSIAVILLSLLNLVFIPFVVFGGNWALYETYIITYLITEGVILLLFLIMTAFDMARIRTIAERGAGSKNLALYCALTLYSDFITLFIYVLRILVTIIASSRNN